MTDEFDEEDGDTYEAPPCERPAMKVPQRNMEENVYLERAAAPSPSRQGPPSRPSKTAPGKSKKPELQDKSEDTYIDPNAKTPPQVNRKEKPGKKVPPRPVSVPQADEDVYLDPNEGQDDNDDLYLEPDAGDVSQERQRVCPSIPSKIPLIPPSPGPRGLTIPMMKPPVPRDKSTKDFSSDGTKGRRTSFPGKVPPPMPAAKPALPTSLKEHKPSPSSLRVPRDGPGVKQMGLKLSLQSGPEDARLQDKDWFAGNCDRKAAEAVLHGVGKDGTFLVRLSSAQGARQPYTLVVLYMQKVYNIPIRYLEESRSYALGKEGKRTEEVFGSLSDIITHHASNPILLIDSKSQAKHTTYLSHPARP
ncbi:B-cell linker protein isoform X2 [Lepisosteus oculatus]